MKITFCINTAVNERNHIELLFRSLARNLTRKDHDIIVYVENDNQDTVGFLKTQKSVFSNLTIVKNPLPVPIGYARNINMMFEMAKTEIVSYIQSDMVLGPNYDEEILKFLTPDTIISATRIEPPLHPASPEKITHDFGLDPTKFDLEAFSPFAEKHKKSEITDFWFAPFTLYKKIWVEIGGHDTLFRRSREDSDLLYRFSMKGIKTKQAWNAIVYHFTCTSSRGIEWWTEKAQQRTKLQQGADQIEMMRFLRKWPSFKHTATFDPEKEYKYQISVNLTNVAPVDYSLIRNYFRFHRIYVDNPHMHTTLIKEFENFHSLANNLLNISPENWESYRKYYRTWDATNLFPSEPIIGDDVILNVDLKGAPLDIFLQNPYFNTLPELIHSIRTDEPGEYEIEELGAKLVVNRVVNRIGDNVVVQNPPMDDVRFEYL